jgi:hypothetical protein
MFGGQSKDDTGKEVRMPTQLIPSRRYLLPILMIALLLTKGDQIGARECTEPGDWHQIVVCDWDQIDCITIWHATAYNCDPCEGMGTGHYYRSESFHMCGVYCEADPFPTQAELYYACRGW